MIPAPLVGRDQQLAVADHLLSRRSGGQSVLTITGEAGIGKTAFLAEIRRRATRLGWTVRHVQGDVPGCLGAFSVDQAGPVLVSIDDAHRLGSRGVTELVRLITQPPGGRVVIALTYRPARLEAVLAAVLACGTCDVTDLDLPALTFEQTRLLLGSQRTNAAARRLFALSEGNPAYLAASEGSLAALSSDVDSVAEPAIIVAHAAAVLVDDFTVADLETVAQVSAEAVAEGVDILVREDVLRPGRDGRMRFRHPLVQQSVYEKAGVSWLRRAHARAAAMLSARGEAAQVLAEHLRRSAAPGDLVAARQLTCAAAEVRLRSAEAAARWYQAAFALLPQNHATRARRGRLLLSRAAALTAGGHLIKGRDAACSALELLPQRGWRVRRQALLLSARIELAIGRFDEAAALLRRAGDACPGHDAVTSAIRVELAGTQVMKGDFEMARTTAELILTQQAPVNQWEQAAATGIIALAFYVSGDAASATVYADQMGALIDASSDRELVPLLGSMVWLGWTDMFLGRYEHAQRRQARAAQVARASRQHHVLINLLVGSGGALRYLGRLADSRDCYEEAYEAARVSGSDVLVVATLAMLCRIHTWLGEHEVALEYGRQSVLLAKHTSGWFTAIAPAVLAQARLEAGQAGGCVEAVLAAAGGPELARIDLGSRPDWYELLTRASIMEGDLDEASGWAKRAREATFELEVPGNAGFAWLACAQVASAEGDHRQAVTLATTAVKCFDKCGNHLDSLRAKLIAARGLAASGKRAAAADLIRKTAGAASACGAAEIQRRCEAELAQWGKTGLPLETLTAREREVADLVAAGCTNREIASKLFLSVKTVERHLARIFGKLEITSRARLAAMIAAAAPS